MSPKLVAAAAALALAAVLPVAAASGATVSSQGLWPADSPYTGSTQDDDGVGPVELGVRFSTSQPVTLTGVRAYRVDEGAVTGSLWSNDGTRLATGDFPAWTGPGWYDLVLDEPVLAQPGTTYVASYFSPNASYGYTYEYFAGQSYTVGPVTALASVEGQGNGTYCYPQLTSCSFPDATFRDSNYWVSPLWTEYRFTGFFEPVSTTTWSTAKAGRAIPVKFSLGGDFGLDVLAEGRPAARYVPCPGSSVVSEVLQETSTAGMSGLQYDPASDTYTYVWKTNKAWSATCVEFDLGLDDGSSHTFKVQFTK